VIEGLDEAARFQCAGCRAQFHLGGRGRAAPAAAGPDSRWANAARLLGILSVPLPLGPLAVVAGLLGLRDLRRHPARRGIGRAVFGIVAGVVTSMGWAVVGLIVAMAVLAVRSKQDTTDPDQVAGIALQIGTFQAPPGLVPVEGKAMPAAGLRRVAYGHQPQPAAVVVVGQFPPIWSAQQQGMESLLRELVLHQRPDIVQVEETRQRTYTIRGQPVQVTERLGTDRVTGRQQREYIAFFPGEGGPLGVMVVTGDKSAADDPAANLDEDEVQQFFESFR
jgi:hypothetical protein